MRYNAALLAMPCAPARRALALALVTACVLTIASHRLSAASDPAPAGPPTTRPAAQPAEGIAKWFADLAHPDAEVREAARVDLMGLKRKDLATLKRLVADGRPLAPAQAVVLRDVVSHVYLAGDEYPATPEGFLGVSLPIIGTVYTNFLNLRPQAPFIPGLAGQMPDPEVVEGVAIVRRMPGFAGARFLEDGDVLLGIEEHPGVRLRDSRDLSSTVQAAGAGQTLHFQILRQGQVVRVPVKLDPRPRAANVPQMDMEDLLRQRSQAADEHWEQWFAPLLEKEERAQNSE